MNYTFWSMAPIILLPFVAFVINSFFIRRFTSLGVAFACATIFSSFLLAVRIFYDVIIKNYSVDYHIHKVFNWFDISHGEHVFKVDLGFYVDNMSAIMLLMVTGTAFLIHIFSTYYMKDDERYGAFFVYLPLFSSAMLGLVLSDNLLSFFCFWELMGFCSYSLIGFYYKKEGAGDASIKAFMTTRVGDVFFLLGILAIWNIVGSVNFIDIYNALGEGLFAHNIAIFGIALPVASLAAFSIFMGTIGKSAQVPLQVWLPDAMWGPTPCSALIHAATMVAAGVYLSLRMYPLMEAGQLTTLIAYVGAITAFGAATIALIQTDIKGVLAYSTISQLGYMVLGVGVGAYNAAFMHLITHAIFKACLFLSAGSVIHSLHDHYTHEHVQEMPRMGGLRHKMPFTFWSMMFCTFAIAGIPLWSGFVSKDRILGDALLAAEASQWLIVPTFLGFLAAFLTSFYMFRMIFLTFFGSPRDKELYDHTKKEKFSFNRNAPLIVLSVFTFGIWFSGSLTGQGFVKIFGGHYEWFSTLVEKPDKKHINKFVRYERQLVGESSTQRNYVFQRAQYDPKHGLSEEEAHHIHKIHKFGAGVSIIIAIAGFMLAFLMYIRKSINPDIWVRLFSPWHGVLQKKYCFDDFYVKVLIQKILLPCEKFLAWVDMGIYDRYAIDGWEKINRKCFRFTKYFDDTVVDSGLVDGSGVAVKFFNVVLRAVQSGKVQFYFIILIVVLVGYILNLN